MNFSADNRYWCRKAIDDRYLERNKKQLRGLRENTVVYDWWYDGGNEAGMRFFEENGFTCIPATSTHGCMTASLNLGQQINQHALIKDAARCGAAGLLVTDWLNAFGYHAEQMYFNFASGLAMAWSGCDDRFIQERSREAFEKDYALLRYGTEGEALLRYLHASGDSGSPLLALFPPTKRGVYLRKQLFFQTNPLQFFIDMNREFGDDAIRAYEEQAAALERLWEEVVRETPDDGYLYALKLPVILHRVLSRRLKGTNEFYSHYCWAAEWQYTDTSAFAEALEAGATCLRALTSDLDEAVTFARYMYKRVGIEKGSVIRLQITGKNLATLIRFVEGLKDGHRPLPQITTVSRMLFGTASADWWLGRGYDWYDEKRAFVRVETDAGAECMYIDF